MHLAGRWGLQVGPEAPLQTGSNAGLDVAHLREREATVLPLGGVHRNHLKCSALLYYRGNEVVANERLSGTRRVLG